MKRMIAIVGKTNSGKDTLANRLAKELGISIVCSYTTRPKRAYETDGIQHRFIDDAKMNEILANETVIAYTENSKTGIRYCATNECVSSNSFIYIINPDGIHWFRDNADTNKTLLTVIYINTPEDEIKRRAINRGDDLEVFEKRLSSEREEFDAFLSNKEADLVIDGTKSADDVYKEALNFVKEVLV